MQAATTNATELQTATKISARDAIAQQRLRRLMKTDDIADDQEANAPPLTSDMPWSDMPNELSLDRIQVHSALMGTTTMVKKNDLNPNLAYLFFVPVAFVAFVAVCQRITSLQRMVAFCSQRLGRAGSFFSTRKRVHFSDNSTLNKPSDQGAMLTLMV